MALISRLFEPKDALSHAPASIGANVGHIWQERWDALCLQGSKADCAYARLSCESFYARVRESGRRSCIGRRICG